MTYLTSSRSGRLASLTALVAATALLAACSSSGSGTGTSAQSSSTSPSSSSVSSSTPVAPSTSAKPVAKPKPVHVSLKLSDGAQVGVGMPIIAFLSRPITDAKAFAAATKVTVNGKPAVGAWYFEPFDSKTTPIEADWRMQTYWPGHATIHMDLPVKGLSAGTGLAFDDSLTSDISTGDANVLTVSNATHRLTVMSDGKLWGTFPVSLGAANTPTLRGTKVIMDKGASVCMKGPGYNVCGIKYTERLTYGGEYLHAAPWNVSHINSGINSSNGCTNLLTADAKKLFDFLEIGDVVQYPDADGNHMNLGEGYGDWNLPWGQWLTGGLYATS